MGEKSFQERNLCATLISSSSPPRFTRFNAVKSVCRESKRETKNDVFLFLGRAKGPTIPVRMIRLTELVPGGNNMTYSRRRVRLMRLKVIGIPARLECIKHIKRRPRSALFTVE